MSVAIPVAFGWEHPEELAIFPPNTLSRWNQRRRNRAIIFSFRVMKHAMFGSRTRSAEAKPRFRGDRHPDFLPTQGTSPARAAHEDCPSALPVTAIGTTPSRCRPIGVLSTMRGQHPRTQAASIGELQCKPKVLMDGDSLTVTYVLVCLAIRPPLPEQRGQRLAASVGQDLDAGILELCRADVARHRRMPGRPSTREATRVIMDRDASLTELPPTYQWTFHGQ